LVFGDELFTNVSALGGACCPSKGSDIAHRTKTAK
jgi:hypothetical protein